MKSKFDSNSADGLTKNVSMTCLGDWAMDVPDRCDLAIGLMCVDLVDAGCINSTRPWMAARGTTGVFEERSLTDFYCCCFTAEHRPTSSAVAAAKPFIPANVQRPQTSGNIGEFAVKSMRSQTMDRTLLTKSLKDDERSAPLQLSPLIFRLLWHPHPPVPTTPAASSWQRLTSAPLSVLYRNVKYGPSTWGGIDIDKMVDPGATANTRTRFCRGADR